MSDLPKQEQVISDLTAYLHNTVLQNQGEVIFTGELADRTHDLIIAFIKHNFPEVYVKINSENHLQHGFTSTVNEVVEFLETHAEHTGGRLTYNALKGTIYTNMRQFLNTALKPPGGHTVTSKGTEMPKEEPGKIGDRAFNVEDLRKLNAMTDLEQARQFVSSLVDKEATYLKDAMKIHQHRKAVNTAKNLTQLQAFANSVHLKGQKMGSTQYDPKVNDNPGRYYKEDINTINTGINAMKCKKKINENVSLNADSAQELMQILRLSGVENTVDTTTDLYKPHSPSLELDTGIQDPGIQDPTISNMSGSETDMPTLEFEDQDCCDCEEGMCKEMKEWNNEPNEEYFDTDFMTNKLSGGINKPHQQFKKEYPGDNPMAVREAQRILKLAGLNEASITNSSFGDYGGDDVSDEQDDDTSNLDRDEVAALAQQLASGKITLKQFEREVENLKYTDYSMRQGEMGNPDIRDDMAWDKEKGDWDDMDLYHHERDFEFESKSFKQVYEGLKKDYSKKKKTK